LLDHGVRAPGGLAQAQRSDSGTFSSLTTNRSVASADELLVGRRLELEVELLEVRIAGKSAIWMPMATRFFCLDSVRSWSRKSR
jgi:hypothetical protein